MFLGHYYRFYRFVVAALIRTCDGSCDVLGLMGGVVQPEFQHVPDNYRYAFVFFTVSACTLTPAKLDDCDS